MTDETFPTDVKNCMKECILSILWARKDIYGFFKDNGCTPSELNEIKEFDAEANKMSRARMIDTMFSSLSERADNGLGQFRAMLQALKEWSHFDPFYFDNLQKLDRNKANRNLDHLRQLIEIRDARIKDKEARRREEAASRKQPNTTETREALLTRFLDLYSEKIPPQRRGYDFEELLRDIAKQAGLEVTNAFRRTGEQIDGGLKYDGENYLLEAKWHGLSASTEPLYTFASKIEGKMYGRGLFISVNGFSPDPVRALVQGKAIKTVLIDGQDLTLSLEGHITFRDMLDEKIRAAQLKGQIYIHPLTKAEKIAAK